MKIFILYCYFQGAVKSYSDIFGMEGSFRQLDFD